MDIKAILRMALDMLGFKFPTVSLWSALLFFALLFSLGTGYYIWKDGIYKQIVTQEIAKYPKTELSQLWFAPDGALIGVKDTSPEFEIRRWKSSLSESPRESWTVDEYSMERAFHQNVSRGRGSEPINNDNDVPIEAISRDGSRFAYLFNGVLLLQSKDDGQLRYFEAKVKATNNKLNSHVFALTFTDSGLIVLAYADGRVEFLDSGRFPSLNFLQQDNSDYSVIRTVQTNLKRPSLLYPFKDYLTVVSPSESSLVVLDTRAIPRVQSQGYPLSPISNLSVAMSDTGRIAVGTGASKIFVGQAQGGDVNIPLEMWGKIRTLAFADEGRILVGGDFQDIYAVAEGETPRYVASAPHAAYLLAVSPNRLAYATPDGVVLASRSTARILKTRAKMALSAWGVALLVLVLIYVSDWQARRRKAKANALEDEKGQNEELSLPVDPPQDLVQACAAGECVLYGGAGLSAPAGFPTWKNFVGDLLEWAHDNNFIKSAEASSYRAEIATGQADPVADSIVSRLKTNEQIAQLHSYLRRVFIKHSSVPEVYRLIKEIKFSAVLTTNFDDLFERNYSDQPESTLTPQDTEPLLDALTKRKFFILKLYGTLDRPETVMVAPVQYEDAVTGNSAFSQFMETLFFSRTLLFVGASLEGIDAYLRGISLPKNTTRSHYALVAVSGNAWRAKADLLERRYDIKVLPFTLKDDQSQLRDFLRTLADQIKLVELNEDGEKVTAASRLKRLTLKNIGPFDSLTLDFDAKWNILLGDNGVGKSTILESIAVAICGEKAQPFAWRLVKSKCSTGQIVLETDNKTRYVTDLVRIGGDAVELRSTTARLLESEGWMAIGFPPLRTTSWEPPKGPEAEPRIKSRPVPEDLLPLVKGEPDPRMDKLKQWVVNLDYHRVKSESEGKGQGEPYKKLIDKLFEVIGEMAKGLVIQYGGIEPKTNRIIIRTDDGSEVPLESVSQGMVSLIGWVGIVLQRLFEVYDQDDDPTQRYALILMDELDAHMHPAWQQSLVSNLQKVFPNAQFIATTHSPLVIGGLPVRQVMRFARIDGKIVRLEIAPDMTIGYADQLLTSKLFGLPTTLDQFTQDKMTRYNELLGKKQRDNEEEAEYRKLEQELLFRVTPPSNSYQAKHDEALNQAKMLKEIGERLQELSADGGQSILARAEKMLSDIERGQD